MTAAFILTEDNGRAMCVQIDTNYTFIQKEGQMWPPENGLCNWKCVLAPNVHQLMLVCDDDRIQVFVDLLLMGK